jgi:glycosyltransferase involved in cell wall biosynthesis
MPDLDTLNANLLNLLPADAEIILEIGCGAGAMGAQYKRINPFGQYMGLEADPSSRVVAASYLDFVATSISELPIQPGEVDCIVYRNTLKSSPDLLASLQEHLQWLRPNGQVIAYVPNLQYWQRLNKLLRGKWEDESEFRHGTSQLHFLTLESIKDIFSQSGLHIYEFQTDYPAIATEEAQQLDRFLQAALPLVQYLGLPPENFKMTSQAIAYLVKATKSALSVPRLLVQTFIAAAAGCDRIRVLEPDRFTSSIPGTRTISATANQTIRLNAAFPDEEKVFLWQRALLLYPQDIQKQKAIAQRGYLIVAEHDDDPFFWPENGDNKYLLFWSSHCVQTSTQPLAEHLRQFNPNVTVFQNHLAYLPPERDYSLGHPVTLFFGALNRQKDWELLMPALNRVLAKFPEVLVKVIHDQQFFDAITTKQKQFQPWCPYEQYQAILHTCDIGVLPLIDTQFNRMKSDLKFLEHAGHGVAALASPTVYANTISEGETGLIYRSPEEFEMKLTELILNRDLRQTITRKAHNWVKEHRLLCHHYRERREWYLEMRSQLPRLNDELRDRCPAIFE